ncbi:MAG TPA: beta-xylosidase [Caulobacterales bacterium]|nr:beta-xylosidase [Caulobacterales bacterium]
MRRRTVLTGPLALGLLGCATPATAARSIAADIGRAKGPSDRFWRLCVGADHPGILLRPANLAHLELAHRELGFEYIRFHGIFHDDMEAYREVGGRPVYNFERIGAVYAAILRIGMKPFVELSFMPHDLARDERTIFYWQANGSPPKDYGKWAAFIRAFADDIIARFGRDEVRTWKFEIWNEPNLDGFWHSDQAEYFRLYDVTANALRAADAGLQIGGPSTAGAAWVPEMIAHAQTAGAPLDFITTHTYGVDGGFLDADGHDDNKLSPNPDSIAGDVRRVREQIEASPRAGLPLHFTEWSTSYNPRDPVHDAYLSAPFILEKLKRCQGLVQSMSYWTYTDLFEEAGPPPSSFHGGFGLINREGVRKPAFFAYKYLNALGSTEIEQDDPHAWVTKEGDDVAALIWDYRTPNQQESDRPYFTKLHPPEASNDVVLRLASLKPGAYRLALRRVGFQANDAYSQYLAWGRPQDLSADQLAQLQALTADAPEHEARVRVGADGVFAHRFTLRSNDAVLVTLKR